MSLLITTPKDTQLAIINYYKVGLKQKNINLPQSSSTPRHLRINYKDDVHELLNSILKCDITYSTINISGTYTTQEVEIKEKIPGANIGDKIYLVVTKRSTGILSTKQLNPDSLGLGGKTISKSSFLKTIKTALTSKDIPEHIRAFLMDLLDASNSRTGNIKSDHIESISDSDMNIISKDFGEISSAYWLMNQYDTDIVSITYPSISNLALVDYYANYTNKKLAISAKSNKGAPPSINAIVDVLKNIQYSGAKDQAKNAIIAISKNSTVDGIIIAARELKIPGYVWLKKNLFNNKDFTAQDCETVFKKVNSYQAALTILKPFYNEINRSASKEIAERLYKNNSKKYGLIISPLGYHLVDKLNDNDLYLSVLTDAASSIEATQVYTNINRSSKSVTYDIHEFKTSNFKFEYNSNAGQPNLKKISFKMKK